jgi:hypothetical protein
MIMLAEEVEKLVDSKCSLATCLMADADVYGIEREEDAVQYIAAAFSEIMYSLLDKGILTKQDIVKIVGGIKLRKVEHVCGATGFGHPGDVCAGCEERTKY